MSGGSWAGTAVAAGDRKQERERYEEDGFKQLQKIAVKYEIACERYDSSNKKSYKTFIAHKLGI